MGRADRLFVAALSIAAAWTAGCGLERIGLVPDGAGGGPASASTASTAATGGSAVVAGPGGGGNGGAGGETGGAGGGTPPLADDGVVVRYYLDEASSGTTPAEVLDAAPAPLNLPITYLGQLAYAEVASQRGLAWSELNVGDRASIPVDGTKLQSALQMVTRATIEVVLRVEQVMSASSRIVHVGTNQDPGSFTLASTATGTFDFRLNHAIRGEWNVPFPTGESRLVLHAVLDTTQSVDTDRVKLYADGVLQSNMTTTPPGSGEVLVIPSGEFFVLGNREQCCRSFVGALHYAAVYSKALDAAIIGKHVARLTASDDASL